MPDYLVKLTQATVRVINYQYCLTVQDDVVRSAAEDHDGANLLATGGPADLVEEGAFWQTREKRHGRPIGPVGAFVRGLAHKAERVTF